MKRKIGYGIFAFVLALLFSTTVRGDIPSGATYWVEPGTPGALKNNTFDDSGAYDHLYIKTYANSYQECWDLGFRSWYDLYEDAGDFDGDPSIWATELGDEPHTNPLFPTYGNLCVYPANSSYLIYIHPISWFQLQPDKNLGKPQVCDLFAGNPVNAGTGNKFEEVLDLSISTPGIPFEFRRYYNSQGLTNRPLGYGWTHTFDMRLEVVQTTPSKRVRIWDADGRALYFSQISQTFPDGTHFYGEAGVTDRLTELTAGGYVLRRKEGDLAYSFGSNGKLNQVADPSGNTLTLAYDGTSGLLNQVSNNFGKSISILYQGDYILSVTDPKGQSIIYENVGGDLKSVTYPDSRSIGYQYTSHQLTDKKDTAGQVIGHWAYSNGRVSSHYRFVDTSAVPQEKIDLVYNLTAATPNTTLTNSRGTTTYTLGLIDGMRTITALDGCASCGGGIHKSFGYDGRLNLTGLTYTEGTDKYTTEYTYETPANAWETHGDILQVRRAKDRPEVQVTDYTYQHRADDPFLLTQSTETRKSVAGTGLNTVITTDYNAQGKVVTRTEAGYILINETPTAGTRQTTYGYNSPGQLTNVYGPRAGVADDTTLEYYDNLSAEGNNRGQLKAVVNALGQRTELSEYDANGNVGAITDGNGVITRYTHDERNRLKTATNVATGAMTQYDYDDHGNVSDITFPEGNGLHFQYNLADRLTEIHDDLGNKIKYHYDVEGNRDSEELYDPSNVLKKSLTFTFDAYNRLEKVVTPTQDYLQYGYDQRGNRTSVKDLRGRNSKLDYDALNRLKTITQTLDTATTPRDIHTQQGFDTQDNLKSVTDPENNATQYKADDFGHTGETVSPDTGATRYIYDEAGNLTQRTDAKGTVINYGYDALNRLTSVEFPSDTTQNISYSYDSAAVSHGIGRLTGRTDPSGSYVFHYDVRGNLIQEDKTVGGVLYSTHFGYNTNNSLTSITYPSGRVVTFERTVASADRIASVKTTLSGNPVDLASSIEYLPFGNITGLVYGNGLILDQGYDSQYRVSPIVVSGVLDLGYTYYADGSVLTVSDPLTPAAPVSDALGAYSYLPASNILDRIDGTQTTEFGTDANGNITSENSRTFQYDLLNRLVKVLEPDVTVARYVYNAAGQRIKKITGSWTTVYHYDLNGRLIAETDGSGQTLAEYVYLGDQPLALIVPNDTVYYFHNDGLGTPRVLTDATGEVAWKASYSPFGQANILVENVQNPFRFAGQYFDAETGFHYNYYRYYDPRTGRYITPDPIGLAGGINPFVYTLNDPVNRALPTMPITA